VSAFTGSGAVYPFKAANTGCWTWVLAEPLTWEVRWPDRTWTITVPALFETDLGSIPWWCRSLFNPADPQASKAYILHDWILKTWGPEEQFFAAGELRKALRALNVAEWKRKAQLIGVTAGMDRW